jgi:hypothetical protein
MMPGCMVIRWQIYCDGWIKSRLSTSKVLSTVRSQKGMIWDNRRLTPVPLGYNNLGATLILRCIPPTLAN